MKGATLHQRLACGATPRRCWPATTRPGTRVCVIVPSKDNASGSSGKRVPLLWTFSDSGSSGGLRGVLKHKQVLEEVFSRDAAEEPQYQAAAAAPLAGQQQAAEEQQGEQEQVLVSAHGTEADVAASAVTAVVAEEEVDAEELDLAALRERIQSAALASTSAPSAAVPFAVGAAASSVPEGGRLGHHNHQQQHHQPRHHHQQQQPQQQQRTLASAVPHSLTGGASLNGALTSNGASNSHSNVKHNHHCNHQPRQHLHQQQQHAVSSSPGAAAAIGAPVTTAGEDPQLGDRQQHQQHFQSLNDSNGNGHHSPEPQQHNTVLQTDAAAAAAGPAAAPVAQQPQQDTSIPGSIWILCFISAALTCASCVFNTALPIYMVSELKMSMRSMGMFEGLLEAFSYVVRMCSGVVSDRMTSRKAAITLGFAAGAAAKFGMASAGTVGLLFAGKAVDRLANGIQAAPRDALIGDLSPPGVRSACFGLAQSLRKWGSAVGALAAFFLMKASNNNYQLIFYSAATVSLTACLAFILLVPAHTRTPTPMRPQPAVQPASAATATASSSPEASAAATAAAPGGVLSGVREFFRSVASMGVDFYRMLGVISLYALGHINESLLEARAMEVGFGKAEATLVVAAIAAVTFLTAYPLGRLDDRYGAGTTFAVGIGALIAGDLVLLLSGPHPMALFASCLFLGVHWAVIQGPLLSIVSGLAPAHMRGTAFGIFYTVMAFTAVAANTMYGTIWHTYGANAAFATSAALMSAVLAALPYMLPASARRGTGAAASSPSAVAPVSSAAGPLAGLSMPSLGGHGDGGKAPGLVPSPLSAAA